MNTQLCFSLATVFVCMATASQMAACGGGGDSAPSPTTAPSSAQAPTPPPVPAPAPAPEPTPAPITAPSPAPVVTPAEAGGDCSAVGSILTVPGTAVNLEYDTYSDSAGGKLVKEQQKLQVNGGTTFRQETGLLELSIDVTNPSGRGNSKGYGKAVGLDGVSYGVTTSGTANDGTPVNTSTYYTPALTIPLSPALNVPYSRNVVNTVTLNGVTQSNPISQTTTFVAVELVSLPAGIFVSCKSKVDVGIAGVVVTAFTWTAAAGRLKGVMLKTTGAIDNQLKELSAVPLVNGR